MLDKGAEVAAVAFNSVHEMTMTMEMRGTGRPGCIFDLKPEPTCD